MVERALHLTTPSHPREIVSRRALMARFEALTGKDDPQGAGVRAKILGACRDSLTHGTSEIGRRLEAGATGADTVHARAYLMDQIIRCLYDFAAGRVYLQANPSAAERLAVVAVGGYGRGELAPHSDLDLLFLLPYKITPFGEQVIEYILYMLWDMGLKVGQATRSIDESLRLSRSDMTIRTTILEARYVWGDQALHRDLAEQFEREIQTGSGIDFVEAKLAERDERHRRMGDSRYVLEPNIKDGKGGLRDLHTLFWIARYLYKVEGLAELRARGVLDEREVGRFEKAQNFLWTLRCHLHLLTGRAEERLTFDVQPEIGRRLGYRDHAGSRGVERFMKHYFLTAKDVGDLTRIFCAALEAEHRRKPRLKLPGIGLWRRQATAGFGVDGGRLTVADAHAFEKAPVDILRLFHVAQAQDLDIHPASLRLITRSLRLIDEKLRQDPEANRLFLEILTSPKGPETTLRRMNEAGVFGRFVPDFGRVVAQMQFDMYHVYTVDEHTIFALGILHRIETGELKAEVPVASRVVPQILSRRVLYLAVMLHDIAKGRGGDHSLIGAEIAQKLCPRMGLTQEETETVAWLVRHHLLMSNTAFRRDIDDPATVSTFTDAVQSLERLRLLLVLTVADIRAVGPRTWNGWKATLLRELYFRAEEHLAGGLITEGREARAEAALQALRQELADWSEADFAAHRARGTPAYWLGFDTAAHAKHARLIRAAELDGRTLALETRVDRWRAVSEVTIYTVDHSGLVANIAGALALSGAGIVDARIFTLANGMALDTFTIQDSDGGAYERPDRLARLAATIERTLAGELKPAEALARMAPRRGGRVRSLGVVPRVLIDNKASGSHTVIEINGQDRPGLVHRLARSLTGLNLQISSAKISTFGIRAIDVFYVKDTFGLKVDKESRLKEISRTLLEVLNEGEAKEPAAVRLAKAGS